MAGAEGQHEQADVATGEKTLKDRLYAWGDNFNGELGDGTRINGSLPVKVALPLTVTALTQVAAGRNNSYAITNDGLHAWGQRLFRSTR